ncbi:MAG TPA: hypothetical protein VLA19_09780 [Herpetosiphonaceae bacterium]|nr:hypothetical protein [Herpetosiphonaceae bacterium]
MPTTTTSTLISGSTGTALDRVRYFSRQLITADDMRAEQDYFREKLRRHNCMLHGWGVVYGCEVVPNSNSDHPWQVQVCPGYLITPRGDEIVIGQAVNFDLGGNWPQVEDPCKQESQRRADVADSTVYLAACYQECPTRPVRVHPIGCGCDEADCEYSRIRDSFTLLPLTQLPAVKETTAEQTWKQEISNWLSSLRTNEPGRPPVAPCPTLPEDNCVVLAGITLPTDKKTPIEGGNLADQRRALYSTAALEEIIRQLARL